MKSSIGIKQRWKTLKSTQPMKSMKNKLFSQKFCILFCENFEIFKLLTVRLKTRLFFCIFV